MSPKSLGNGALGSDGDFGMKILRRVSLNTASVADDAVFSSLGIAWGSIVLGVRTKSEQLKHSHDTHHEHIFIRS